MKTRSFLNFLSVVLILCLSKPVYAEPIEYREGPDGGQIIDLDGPEPAGTANQTGVGYDGGDLERTGAQPRINTKPPVQEGGRFPWGDQDIFADHDPAAHGQQATAEDFEAQSRANRAQEAAERAQADQQQRRQDFGNQMQNNMEDTRPGRKAGRGTKPSAEDLDKLLQKLDDPNISELNKKRIAGVIFYHNDVYRKAVMLEQFSADSPRVKKFLEYKKAMQQEVISRMGVKYKAKYGEAPKTPIIPFDYNNIFSDDDVVTGTGEVGRRLEGIYNEVLSEVVSERVGRPMTAADRARIDVNGLAWNMTEDAAHLDFSHHEKYINPQSGNANQAKLIEGAKKGTVSGYTYDDNGRMIILSPDETVKEIQRLAVDSPMKIPGIDPKVGSGSISDFIRMAELHKIRPNGKVTVEEVQQFLRNQKYSQRVIGDYEKIFQNDAKLLKEYEQFIETSNKLRKATSIRETAELLEASTGLKIFSGAGEVDYKKLTEAMMRHQNKQLNAVLPKMMGEVTKTEAYKIVEWLKNAGKGNRALLRKKMALTYAPLNNKAIATINEQLDKMPIDEADKKFLKDVVSKDSRQIREYAHLLEMDPAEFSAKLKIEGNNMAVVKDFSKNAKFKPLNDAISARPGGSRFKAFLETKTAKALNLDVMLSPEASKSSKFMQWSMIMLAAQRAYGASERNDEALKKMGMAIFEMVPFVASALRFSEDDYRESAKEFMMDILPPIALANLGVQFFNYAANTTKDAFTESIWEDLARQVLNEMSDDDFEETEIKGYWRLKNRKELLEFLDEVSPGLGKIAKLSSMIEPDIDARMSRNKDVQQNEAALVTILWFEGVKVPDSGWWDIQGKANQVFSNVVNNVLTGYKIDELRARVYEKGIPELGSAPPTDRIAARIMLDNLRIRKELYYDVLNDFMNRIERMYNEEKGDETGYGAIVGKALAVLKELYNNAPEKIKESEWAMEKLTVDYRERVEFLKDYKPEPEDKPDTDIEREMQEIIDDFKKLIEQLVIATDIQLEMRYLDLKAMVYGGESSFESADEILLGDTFRVGFSARVSPLRANQKWTIYYYAISHDSGQVELLAQKNINPRKFNPGNDDGRWIVEAPEKDTFVKMKDDHIKEYFKQERWYFIRPVLAFGDWSVDPVSMVGPDAIKNPIDYPELFAEDRAAFVGERAEFGVVRAALWFNAPLHIYKDDNPSIKMAMRFPAYAQEELSANVALEAMAYKSDGTPPSLDPSKHGSVVNDRYSPPEQFTESRIVFDADAKEGSYFLSATPKIRGFADDYQPRPISVTINYYDQNNPEGENADEEEDEEKEDGESLQSKLEALLAQMTALHQEAQAKLEQVKGQAIEFVDQVKTYDQQVTDMQAKINRLVPVRNVPYGETPQDILNELKSLSEKLAASRTQIESLTLAVCEAYERIDVTILATKADSIQSQAKAKYAELQRVYNDAKYYMQRMDTLKGKITSRADAKKEAKLADELAAEAQVVVAEGEALGDRGRALQGEIVGMEDFTAKVAAIKSEAQTLYDQAKAKKDGMSKEEKKQLKADKRIYKSITSLGKKVTRIAGSNKKLIKNHGMEVMTMGLKVEGLRSTIKNLRQRAGAEQLARDLKMNAEILAMYEAGMLYAEPVNEAYANSKICLNGVNFRHGQIATPEARVEQKDCTMYPGTFAKWDSAAKMAKCYCPDNLMWLKQKNKCVTKREHALANANCKPYRNTHAVYNEYKQRAECDCNSGLVWNASKTGCVMSRQDQVAQTSCSHLGPQAFAFWSDRHNSPRCTCRSGYQLNSNATYCVPIPQPVYDNSGYGSSGGYGGNQRGNGFDATEFLGAVTDIIEAVDNGRNNGRNNTNNRNTGNTGYGGSSNSNCAYNYTLAPAGGLYNPDMVYKCGCSGWTYSKSSKKCIKSGSNTGITTNRSRGGYTGGNQNTGLSDVTVNTYSPTITMWDHGTEDFDTVSISVNGVMQVSSLRLTKAKQTVRLNLRRGINTLKITALNEGDPAINRRLNLRRGNAAAISITNVTKGKSYQQWTLYTGQSGTIKIQY